MALTLRNDAELGVALLTFDREFQADELDLFVFDVIRGQYLGPSTPERKTWLNTKTHFFTTTLVSAKDGSSTYRIGPELTSIIPDGSMIRFESIDNIINEQVVWENIHVIFEWPSGYVPVTPIAKARGIAVGHPDEAAQSRRAEEGRKRIEEEEGKKKEEEERKRREDEERQRKTEEERKKREDDERRKREEAEEEQRKRDEEERKRQEEERRRAEGAGQDGGSESKTSWLGLLVGSLVLFLLGSSLVIALRFDEIRDFACDRMNICDRERAVYRQAVTCASPLTCGADSCLAEYRRDFFPYGRFKAQIEQLAREKGGVCTTPPPVVTPGPELLKQAMACAASAENTQRPCDVNACFNPLRNATPPVAIPQNQQQRIDRATSLCNERRVFSTAEACANTKPCDAVACFAPYNSQFPSGVLRPNVQPALDRAKTRCVPPTSPRVDFGRIVPRTTGPGFNCSSPNMSVVAQWLCFDGDLAKADLELKEAYDRRMNGLAGPARTSLLDQQRAWITQRDRECAAGASANWTAQDLLKSKRCLYEKTEARRRQLDRM